MNTLTQATPSTSRDGGGGTVAEHYHALAHWLRSLGNAATGDSKTVGITSCARGAGVSTVAANLARAAAHINDRPVLLLDLSDMGPMLATRHALSPEQSLPGEDSQRRQSAKPSATSNLSLLRVDDASTGQSLSTDDGRQVHDLLHELEHDFGIIVVDLPPVDSGLCFAVSGLLSGVLLVIEAENTSGEAAVRAKQRLIHANAAVLGVILNKHSEALN